MRDYFEAEMRKLKDEAWRFAAAYPEQARELNITRGQDRDPYIERLLEGSAFLTAQIRQRIDDDLPDICESLLQQLAPQLIAAYPSATIMDFSPRLGQLQQSFTLKQGARMRSAPVGEEHTACEFVTTNDLLINPVRIASMNIQAAKTGGSEISLRLQADPGIDFAQCDWSDLTFYLHADFSVASHLLLALTTLLRKTSVYFPESDSRQVISAKILPEHLSLEASMLPGSGRHFKGFHLLQDYFCFREKYLFVNIKNLDSINWPPGAQQFDLVLHIDDIFPHEYQLNKSNFKLHAVPAINLFKTSAEPVQLSHQLTEYPLVVDSKARISQQLYRIEAITGVSENTGKVYPYAAMQSFLQHETSGRFYQSLTRRQENTLPTTYLSVSNGDVAEPESLSIDVLATNGHYPRQFLQQQQITSNVNVPDYLTFTNVLRPSQQYMPPTRDYYRWELIAHLSLNYQSLTDLTVLKQVLNCYDWSGRTENARRINGIQNLVIEPTHQIKHGALVQGLIFKFDIDEEMFLSIADVYLFGLVLQQFLGHYVTINHYLEVQIQCHPSNKEFKWHNLPGASYPI